MTRQKLEELYARYGREDVMTQARACNHMVPRARHWDVKDWISLTSLCFLNGKAVSVSPGRPSEVLEP